MAEESETFRHAMVSFAALIYSTKVRAGARGFVFVYYAKALQGLRSLLDQGPLGPVECQVAVCTALQLLSIEVYPRFECAYFSDYTVIWLSVCDI